MHTISGRNLQVLLVSSIIYFNTLTKSTEELIPMAIMEVATGNFDVAVPYLVCLKKKWIEERGIKEC